MKTLKFGLMHLAFAVDDLAGLVLRLETAGFLKDKYSDEYAYRHNAYYIDPDGYEVEFVEYLSDIPQQRNNY